jgi:NADPH2:quinone reductase
MQAAAVKGRIIDVGRMGGLKGEIDLDLHSLKRISFFGVTFRKRSIDEIQTIIRRHLARRDCGQSEVTDR